MSTVRLKGWIDTGTGRQAEAEVNATVQNGVIVAPGGGTAVIVVNKTGSDLARDALVYVSGVTDGVLEVSLADADVADAPAMFYLPAAIPAGASGLAYKSGLSVATLNTNAGNVDDPVYLSAATAGAWTLTPPTGADDSVQVVGRIAVKSATVGQIMWALSEHRDVGSNELQDGAVIEAKIGTGAVTENKIGALAVSEGKLAALAVSSGKLAAAMTTWLNGIRSYVADGMLTIGTLLISAVPEKFKTTTTIAFRIGGITYTKAATDNLVFSAANTINTGAVAGQFWGVWLLQINAAGAVSTKPGGGLADQNYASEALAIAALPAVDANNVQIGYITVQCKAATAWIANTDDMTAASDCGAANFYDLPAPATLPAALE